MYILHSEKPDKYYIGACIDIERRLYEHNIGHSKFTSLGMPWKLMYREEFANNKSIRKKHLQLRPGLQAKMINYLKRLLEWS